MRVSFFTAAFGALFLLFGGSASAQTPPSLATLITDLDEKYNVCLNQLKNNTTKAGRSAKSCTGYCMPRERSELMAQQFPPAKAQQIFQKAMSRCDQYYNQAVGLNTSTPKQTSQSGRPTRQGYDAEVKDGIITQGPTPIESLSAASRAALQTLEDRGQYCAKIVADNGANNRGVDTVYLRSCTAHCIPISKFQATILESGQPAKTIDGFIPKYTAKCEAPYLEVVKAQNAPPVIAPTPPAGSVSARYGLRIDDPKGMRITSARIDRFYNQCYTNREAIEPGSCDCIAKHIIDTINERGSFGRINAAFARSVPQCR